MAGIGKAIKGLGLLAKKYKKGVAKKASIQISKGVVDRNVKPNEVFRTIQGLRKKPKEHEVKVLGETLVKLRKKPSKLKKALTSKETKAFGKGALIGGAVASGVEYKRRKDRGDYKK